jgi:signal transduction histidine kinase
MIASLWGPVGVVALLLLKATAAPDSRVLSAAMVALGLWMAFAWRRRAGAGLTLLTLAALGVEVLWLGIGPSGSRASQAEPSAGVHAVQDRARRIADDLARCAAGVAALPDAPGALRGDRDALDRLFLSLQLYRRCDEGRPSLAVRATPSSTLAWSGRVTDLGAFQEQLKGREALIVANGSLTTSLIAAVQILDAHGRPIGLASAERTVAVQRRIRNEFLADFDLLAQASPNVEVRYLDSGVEAGPSTQLEAGETLVSARGRPVAAVRPASRIDGGGAAAVARGRYQGLLGVIGGLTFGLCFLRLRRGDAFGSAALALTACRAALLLLPTEPRWPGLLLSPEIYSSPGFGRLTGTPLDLLFTTAWVLALTMPLAARVLARPPGPPSWWRALAADLLAVPALAALFAAVGNTVASSPLDLQVIALWPDSPGHFVLHWSLLLSMAAGGVVLTALFAWGGPLHQSLPRRSARFAGWIAIGLAANALWPHQWVGVPLVPAVALYLLAAGLGSTCAAWWPRMAGASLGERAGVSLLATAALTLLLYPTVAHFTEKRTRQQIESDYAVAVLRQPAQRESVLATTRRQIDAMNLLELPPTAGGVAPLIDELAFAAWSRTDLAAFGFSSAVEIQDPSGAVISRFALNLPAFSGQPRTLPTAGGWTVSQDLFPLASIERRVLHARRLLTYHGQVHGAVHVYVGTDFWNLPFLSGRDPYSVLYRTGVRAMARDRSVELFAMSWGRDVSFTSSDRPPLVGPALILRARRGPFWTTLPHEEGAQHTYVFSDRENVYGVGYQRKGAGRFAAELVEALTGMVLSASAILFAILGVRTLAGRRTLSLRSLAQVVRERFTLRLFVAFIAVAVLPVVVLESVVRNFVSDRLRREAEGQALERAATARKIVEDYALFQRSEGPGQQLVTDSALVWVASAIRNDLDVFLRGRLHASSKRELYASGLLAPRASGRTYRAIVLEGRPSFVGAERIGGFSYMVASVPVHLDAGETGILSIPLALRQRETEATLADLDRTIRLSSILFLAAAAALAHSMARRISGPVLGLTEAAQRIARGDLGARVTTTSRDEFLTLVEAFNQMTGDLERQRVDLERSNRRAAWADMARQVAHEVKNPLTPIQLSAEHLRRLRADRSADFDGALESCTETILEQVRKLREIVTEFSAFARPPGSSTERIDVVRLVREAAEPYRRSLPPAVTLVVDVPEDGLPTIRGDRRLLERALLNLIENALQAVGESGLVTVHVRLEHAGGARLVVEVEDSGVGLEGEAKARAFEPFFSTKTGGSGLGLALVRKIAEDHGGGAMIDGRPGSTRARMWLSVDAAEDPPAIEEKA